MGQKDKRERQRFYRYEYSDVHKEESTRRQPKKQREYHKEYGEYFADNFCISLHYLNRYIERKFLENPDKYNIEKKTNLAKMLQDILPIGTGLSTVCMDEEGYKSIITEGVAITGFYKNEGYHDKKNI